MITPVANAVLRQLKDASCARALAVLLRFASHLTDMLRLEPIVEWHGILKTEGLIGLTMVTLEEQIT